jgi:aminopeptidase N
MDAPRRRQRPDEQQSREGDDPMTDTRSLIAQLSALTGQDIRNVAEAYRARPTVADDVAWWTATAHIERLLRGQRMGRVAAAAAGQAARALRHAAHNAGLALDDPDVVHVARGASDAAAAITAGPDAQADAAYFLARLRPTPAQAPPLAAWPEGVTGDVYRPLEGGRRR